MSKLKFELPQLTEEDQIEMANSAITNAGQILHMSMILGGIPNYISGTFTTDYGNFELTFRRVEGPVARYQGVDNPGSTGLV